MKNGPTSSQTVRLRDGRRLAYSELGAESGRPLLHFHGVPSSRLEGLAIASGLEGAGVRLISVDRPGIGGSDFQRRRRLLDWPGDVAQLADALGLERFAVLGYSGGGPYALACARAIPERLTAAGVAAGLGPPDMPRFLDGVNDTDRRFIPLARRAPPIAALALRAVRRMTERNPERLHGEVEKELSEADREEFADAEARRLLTAMFLEAMRQGSRGLVHDYALYARPWGFDLAAISCAVRIWHGDQDELVPMRHSEHVAAAVPGAELAVVPGKGHFLGGDQWRAVAGELVRAGE